MTAPMNNTPDDRAMALEYVEATVKSRKSYRDEYHSSGEICDDINEEIKIFETILRALETPVPVWMDIESAPKDGASILICDSYGYVCEGHYENVDGDRWYEKNTCASDHYDGQIYNAISWTNIPTPPELKD